VTDTYGIPNYKEANPAVFSVVSFPFLFGVMFGDVLHGFLLTVFAIYLCFSTSQFAKGFSSVKYFFLLMGINATFCGFIYNDFSSVTLQTFGKSCYQQIKDEKAYREDKECVYPLGIDPIWYLSTDEINFTNSFKMKVAVILGVAQMLLGTFLKGSNALYFGNYVEFIFVFISQVVLMVALFGFMDYLIIIKWLTNWANLTDGQKPPAVVQAMITMFMQGGVKEKMDTDADLMQNQTSTMQTLVLCALISLPLMLLVEPIWHALAHGKKTI
jgi:V-type H+-transporting ATPase subunit a